jgi:ferrochelatase
MGDPYQDRLFETADLTAKKAQLEPERWSWCFQSVGRGPDPWFGPQLPEHLDKLAKEGVQEILVVPVGFVSDHVEISNNIPTCSLLRVIPGI